MRTRIIPMITLTSDKLPLIRAGFPMKGLDYQGPRSSMPKRVASLRDLAPPLPGREV
jgi:hypothetical protein